MLLKGKAGRREGEENCWGRIWRGSESLGEVKEGRGGCEVRGGPKAELLEDSAQASERSAKLSCKKSAKKLQSFPAPSCQSAKNLQKNLQPNLQKILKTQCVLQIFCSSILQIFCRLAGGAGKDCRFFADFLQFPASTPPIPTLSPSHPLLSPNNFPKPPKLPQNPPRPPKFPQTP